ncbi:MAG: hypothetical protein JXR68_03475 [Bacteroidales bacterium]|nr:hypothetical protein [Bacteroidales bacterium]
MLQEKLIDKIEKFFTKYRWIFFAIGIILTAVFGALLFDLRLSTSADDSNYILSAQKFIDGDAFPDWHGSFYPIFLSFFIRIFGLNIFILKFLSFLMIITHFVLIYFALRDKVQWTLLIFTLLFSAVCLELLYFGGQTFSEALYLVIQISTIAAFFKLLESINEKPKANLSKHWKEWLVLGFLIFLLTQTRNVGWSMLAAVIIYFLIEKKLFQIIFSVASFLIFYIPFNLYKKTFWNVSGTGFENQFDKILYVNPYDINDGTVKFTDLFIRIWENANLYLSKHFLMVISWKQTTSISPIITILIILLLIFAFFITYKYRKSLFFITLYVYISLSITFITQQVMWDQIRLISIYVPLLVIIITSSIWDFLKAKKKQNLIIILPLIWLLIIIPSTTKTIDISKKHFPILKANIEGDELFGYSDDWQNYLKLVQWTSQNIPMDNVIGCRVPGMAFIYGEGRKFEGIYNFKSKTIDQTIANLESDSSKQHYAFDFYAEGQKFYTLYPFYKYISAIINQTNGVQYIIISVNDSVNTEFIPILQNSQTNPIPLKNLKQVLTSDLQSDYGVYPDSLLNFLSQKQIDYLIAASLRKNPTAKTGEIITTIHRYIFFIELKYPGIFNLIWQEGTNNNEPAMLLKINYNKAN